MIAVWAHTQRRGLPRRLIGPRRPSSGRSHVGQFGAAERYEAVDAGEAGGRGERAGKKGGK